MVIQGKKLFTLEGKLLTPLLSSTSFFKKYGCWFRIYGDLTTRKKPRRSYVGQLVKGVRKAPNQLLAFRGFVKVSCVDHCESRGRKTHFPTDLLILMVILSNSHITKNDYSTLSLGVVMRKINSLLLLNIWTKE